MTRDLFIGKLRAGLVGLPPATIDELVFDYETHFADGAAAGRGEAEVAGALGDPDRLARELRAEAGLKRWETERNPSAAANAVFAVLGLGAIDILVLLPILLSVGGTPIAAIMLTGMGMMSGAAFVAALCALTTIGLINALVWYARLHMRLLSPALTPAPV